MAACEILFTISVLDRSAIEGHIKHVRNKWIYHLVLDAKAAGDPARVILPILRLPDAVFYMAAQTGRGQDAPSYANRTFANPGRVFITTFMQDPAFSGLLAAPPGAAWNQPLLKLFLSYRDAR
jgi:hypothetical protein